MPNTARLMSVCGGSDFTARTMASWGEPGGGHHEAGTKGGVASLPSPGCVKMRIWQWGSGRGRAGMRLCVRWVRREVKFVETPGGGCESLGLGLG